MREYQELGIDTFILSGYPHLEEAYRFADWCSRCCRSTQPSNVTPIRVNPARSARPSPTNIRPRVKQASQS